MDRWDVVVVGGAFSGAATALLLRRWLPGARILVLERAEEFDRKVGEATVEVSGFFLYRVLALYDYLSRDQLPKHGLRYWFADRPERPLREMSEAGARILPTQPSFLLDRARMDEELLARAAAEGAEIRRPARAVRADLAWPESRIEVEDGRGSRRVRTRWVVDASGRHAFLARRLGLHRRVEEHPTAALWGRWRGVADLDGPAFLGPDPRSPATPWVAAARRLATNHFCGYGWWCWLIPLADGATSVGLVYDKRLAEWPDGLAPVERYRRFLHSRPGLRELLAGAALDEEDFRAYGHLPYRTSRYIDRGWALVGDAAAFLDPYYSPGLDHASMSVFATARLIEDDLAGRLDEGELGRRIEEHDGRFRRSFERWLSGLYLDKYEILGDFELTTAAFLLDTASYYLWIVGPIHRDLGSLAVPVFGHEALPAAVAHRIIRFYNRRLARLARQRRAAGIYGRRNAGRRALLDPFDTGLGSLFHLLRGIGYWWRAEIETLLSRLRVGSLRTPAAAKVPLLPGGG